MSAWAVKDKTESWDTVCDRAWAGEPQFVSRGPSQMVVVISFKSYKPVQKRHSVLDALRSCPCRDDEVAKLMAERAEDTRRFSREPGALTRYETCDIFSIPA